MEEICNGCDDDLDGLVDQKRCSDSSGLCTGYQFCSNGGFTKCQGSAAGAACTFTGACSSTCDTDCQPAEGACGIEACNGLDEDGDGLIDEDGVCRSDCCPAGSVVGAPAGASCDAMPDGCGGWRTVACASNRCYQNKCCQPQCPASAPASPECYTNKTFSRDDGCGSTLSCTYSRSCPSGKTCQAEACYFQYREWSLSQLIPFYGNDTTTWTAVTSSTMTVTLSSAQTLTVTLRVDGFNVLSGPWDMAIDFRARIDGVPYGVVNGIHHNTAYTYTATVANVGAGSHVVTFDVRSRLLSGPPTTGTLVGSPARATVR